MDPAKCVEVGRGGAGYPTRPHTTSHYVTLRSFYADK